MVIKQNTVNLQCDKGGGEGGRARHTERAKQEGRKKKSSSRKSLKKKKEEEDPKGRR